ncbi:Gfo/Idh/MocA family protein [Microcella alkaliphila]|uniref:Oxidoreductase family, NAD-binding Rossmann fold domain protein n=1 Tax=Microcella alkaliphila TaxID=279828 RepID=A0A0U5BM11_9MICO|nr:Gfo/Idh/MocA family oxidoreductase [Microcella alkaliphila]BAU31206.1 oxidoreductase family, NAD-binding Rossmann fold domain protein [Microcella alkaliphila]
MGANTVTRAALIGGGFMADVHAHALRANAIDIVGIASSSAARARQAADRLGIDRAYDDVAALLDDDRVDVVHVLTPNASHAPYALAALAADKHVVREKPLATNVRDAQAVVAEAKSRGRVAAVPFVYRFHPMVRHARARIMSGDVGIVYSVQGAYLQDWLLNPDDDNWRVDDAAGGASRAFADIGPHVCDLLEFVTGDRISRLVTLTRTVHPMRRDRAVHTEDLVGMLAQLRSGATVNLLVSQVAAGRKNALSLEIHGALESLRFDQERPEELWIGRRTGSMHHLRNPDELTGDAARLSRLPAGHALGYQDAFTAFVADVYASIARGSVVDGLPVFADGLRAAQLTAAVLDSARSMSWVDVPAVTDSPLEDS